MAKISDVYAGDYVSASELPEGRRIAAVIQFAGVEEVGQQDQQRKRVALTLAAPDGRPWPRKLVCNKTNAGILAASYGDETAGWMGRPIEVWQAPTPFQGKIVPGIKLAVPAPPPLAASVPANQVAIPMPAPTSTPAPGNGAAASMAVPGHTVPLPAGMPTAPDDLNDEIPF